MSLMPERKSQMPDGMEETERGMSNFDHSIDDGFENDLKAGKWGRHSGWDFNARIWWDGQQFVSEPWVYHVPQPLKRANTLRVLMEMNNEEYGDG